MEQSIPGIIWTFYVIIPLVGMAGTIATFAVLNKKAKEIK
jgi:hypothetical protein